MNTMDKIYESVSAPPVTSTVLLTLTILMSLGILVHMYMGYLLFKAKIPSTLTKLLLYLQCIIEGFYSICVIVLANTNNFTPASNKTPVNPFLCYIFQSGAITIIFRVMLFSNIVCQSADRLWALLYPNTYRTYTKYYITGCAVFIPVYGFLASTARIAKVVAIDGSCIPRVMPVNKFAMMIIEITLRYFIPVSILVPINVLVIRKLHGMRRISSTKSQATDRSQVTDGSTNGRIETCPSSVNSLHRTLLMNALLLTIELTFTETIFFGITMTNLFGKIRNDEAAIARVYFLIGVILLDELNPIVSILTVKALHVTALNHWHWVKMVCRIGTSNKPTT